MILDQILTGDARELIELIPDESIDLIFADPVYSQIEDYEWLAREAVRALKPKSACLVWCSKMKLAECQAAMTSSGLSFQTVMFYTVIGKQARPLYTYGIIPWTTPCLVFARGYVKCSPFITDTFVSNVSRHPDGNHKWNKNIAVIRHWINAYSKANAIVLDPFCGSGSVPVACKQIPRHYIGFEIDPETARLARDRVALAQPPLFTVPSQQLDLQL